MLTDQIKNFIKIKAKEEYPNETCGITIDNTPIACVNSSEDKLNSFIISSEELDKHDIKNITAFYHSHKEIKDFSVADIAFSEKLHLKSILYVCDSDLFKEYEPIGAPIPYVGRPFLIGEFDCFTLSRDYFRKELNVNITNIDGFTNHSAIKDYKKWRTEEYSKLENNTLIKDFFIMQGFSEVGDLKKHDLILMRMPGVRFTSHICIYLGENKILHHFSDFSGIMAYTNALKRLTTHILRHESLV